VLAQFRAQLELMGPVPLIGQVKTADVGQIAGAAVALVLAAAVKFAARYLGQDVRQIAGILPIFVQILLVDVGIGIDLQGVKRRGGKGMGPVQGVRKGPAIMRGAAVRIVLEGVIIGLIFHIRIKQSVAEDHIAVEPVSQFGLQG